mmetsp:Transcript_96588/g.273543  ORF Transcript_96588/g.273543 Transcript_96588/m.273543 type:complete len:329 (-) Transcript_96588:535-1521(-)
MMLTAAEMKPACSDRRVAASLTPAFGNLSRHAAASFGTSSNMHISFFACSCPVAAFGENMVTLFMWWRMLLLRVMTLAKGNSFSSLDRRPPSSHTRSGRTPDSAVSFQACEIAGEPAIALPASPGSTWISLQSTPNSSILPMSSPWWRNFPGPIRQTVTVLPRSASRADAAQRSRSNTKLGMAAVRNRLIAASMRSKPCGREVMILTSISSSEGLPHFAFAVSAPMPAATSASSTVDPTSRNMSTRRFTSATYSSESAPDTSTPSCSRARSTSCTHHRRLYRSAAVVCTATTPLPPADFLMSWDSMTHANGSMASCSWIVGPAPSPGW